MAEDVSARSDRPGTADEHLRPDNTVTTAAGTDATGTGVESTPDASRKGRGRHRRPAHRLRRRFPFISAAAGWA